MEDQKRERELNFKDINPKYKKKLIENFIEKINNKNDNNINIQKNNLILKTLCSKLKDIDENNIIIKQGEIIEIKGVINNKGLLNINNDLYKNKKSKKSNFNLKVKNLNII